MAFTRAVSRSAALGLAVLLCASFAQAQSSASFPCPSQTSSSNSSNSNGALAGGYQNINQNSLTNSDILDLGLAVNASFTEWVEQDNNITLCNDIDQLVGNVEFGVLQACSQVVAGTNYGIRYLVQYTCIVDDESALAEDSLVLNTVVYVPLPSSGNTDPQVQSVSLDTSVPVEEAVLPVQFIALGPGSAPDSPATPDNVLAAAPTSGSNNSPPATPYTLEGL